MQSDTNVLSCEHCGETFQRREHRDRHVLRHTGLKPFNCDVCLKSFSRNDTLQRHRNLHRDRQDGIRSPKCRTPRACLSCARLKQRCDGNDPCSRCLVRSATCCYDPSRASRAANDPADSEMGDDGGSSKNISLETPPPSIATNDESSLHLRPQTAQMGHDTSLPVDVGVIAGQWDRHRMVPSSLSCLSDISPHGVPTSSIEGHAAWHRDSDFVAEGPFGGSNSGLFGTADDLWVPWNPMAINLSLPWTLDGLGSNMDQSRPFDPNYEIQTIGQVAAFTPSASLNGTASSVAGASIHEELPEGTLQNHRDPRDTNPNRPRPCRAFPTVKDVSLEVAATEMYRHVPYLPTAGTQGMQDFYRLQRQSSTAPFVHDRILHAFIDLYFEHFDPQFPFLHPNRLNDDEVPWILLLAVAAVGSHYSEMIDAPRYNLALVDLLGRAVELTVSKDILRTDIVTVQSVLLLHILWMFSGSHNERVLLQYKRSMLIKLAWDLLSKAHPQRRVVIDNPDIEAEWRSWLSGEEEIRLLTCVKVIECLSSLSLEIPTNFNLRDATRQLPSPEELWRCKDARSWKHAYQSLPAQQAEKRPMPSSEDWPTTMLRSDAFTCKATLIELFIDEATVARQLYSSRLFRASVASYLQTPNTGIDHGTVSPSLAGFESMRGDNILLNTSVDSLSYATLEGSSTGPHYQTETIFHVLAILRRISLEILNTATGWKTSEENMHRARRKFVDFCQQSPVQARRCLWHATCIFKKTRNSRKLACYDVYSILICTTYIYCYCSFFMSETSASRQTMLARQRSASGKESPPTVVRLDQLRDKSSIERWIQSSGEHDLIHLTGVGLLDGSDDAIRFLRDIERTLKSQIAWRGVYCAFAAAFAQIRRGEMPTESQKENPEEDRTLL